MDLSVAMPGGAEALQERPAYSAHQLDQDRSKHWLLRIRPIVGKYPQLSIMVFLLAIGAIFFQVVMPKLLGNSIDALSGTLRRGNTELLYRSLTLLLLAGLTRSAMNFSVRFTLYKLTYRIEADLRKIVFVHLSSMPLSVIARHTTGQIVSRANTDIRTIQNFLLYLPYVIMLFGTFVLSVVYMFSVDVHLAVIAIASLPLIFLLSLRLRRLVYPLSWLVQSRMADVATVVDENIRGQAAVKIFVHEGQQIDWLQKAASKLRWATNEGIRYRARYAPWIENLAVLSQIAVLLYGGWLVIDNRILLGQLVAFNVYIIMMLIPFRTLGQVLVMGRNATAAARRVFEIVDEPPEGSSPTENRPLPAVLQSIVLERIHYEWLRPTGTKGEKRHQVLTELSTTIEAGKITAIVGKTGSGKSSIADLLIRLYLPQSGRILIDGIDINALNLRQLRSRVILVPQESFLFTDTIANNISFGAPGTAQADIERAAVVAGAHEFIVAQADGYGTLVGEGGVTLSGGQRQRITIAQAVLLNPSVLILDDATSALDSITESRVIESLKREMRGRTMIVISHRASMVQHADEVQLLHDGRIVAKGTHQRLLATLSMYRDAFAVGEVGRDEQTETESDNEYYQRIRNSLRGATEIETSVGSAL